MRMIHELSLPTEHFLSDGDFIQTLNTVIPPLPTTYRERKVAAKPVKVGKTSTDLLIELTVKGKAYYSEDLVKLIGRSKPSIHQVLREYFLPNDLVTRSTSTRRRGLEYIWRFK